MLRITEIRLRNFRAFGDEEAIVELPKGENLLVYGENGSGKSSLYWALRDFLESSVNSDLSFTRNSFMPKREPGSIGITIADDPHLSLDIGGTAYIFHSSAASSTTAGVTSLELAHKQQGFLTYKEIVESYLTDLRTERPNLYSFVVEELLAHHLLPNDRRAIHVAWKAIADVLKKGPPDERQNLWNTDIPLFTKNLGQLLGRIVNTAQTWLTTYFGPTIEFANPQVTIVRRGNSLIDAVRRLEFDIRFHGQDFRTYHNTLNEARLSALAVCLYLAALKEYPDTSNFKPLVLDDVFVGLDTNNRLPLLKLLNDEFVNLGYQLVLTTYDREWFMLAAHWFKQRPGTYGWQQLEMYEEELENVPGEPLPVCPFRPVLVPFRGSYEKATAYFKAKDYPAAGNYLRKALEEVTTSLTPYETGDAEADAKGAGNSVHARFGRLKELRELCDNPLPQDLVDDMLLYQKLVLHPSSHYNTTHSLYREELKTTFRLVQKLRDEKIYRVVRLVDAGGLLRYESADPATYGRYWSECRLLDDLRVVLADGKVVSILACRTQTAAWAWNGVMWAKDKDGNVYDAAMIEKTCGTDRPLMKRPGVIEHTLKPYVVGVDVLRDFHLANHPVSLNELLAKRQAGFPATVQEVL